MEYANGHEYDWQEEVFQKITSLKEMYLPDLTDIYQRVQARYLHEEALPEHLRPDHFEKLKQFKSVMERMLHLLSISKTSIVPGLKDKLDYYETQIISFLDIYIPRIYIPRMVSRQTIPDQSGFINQMQSMTLQDSAPVTHPMQDNLSSCVINRMQSMNLQDSAPETHPMQSSVELGQGNGNASDDWQEVVFQKIQIMKEKYLPDLAEIHRRVDVKLQKQDLIPEKLDKLTMFKTMVGRMIQFLFVLKINITPSLQNRVDYYEKQLIHFLSMHRPKMARQQSQTNPRQV